MAPNLRARTSHDTTMRTVSSVSLPPSVSGPIHGDLCIEASAVEPTEAEWFIKLRWYTLT